MLDPGLLWWKAWSVLVGVLGVRRAGPMRWMRWLVAVTATVAVFGGCLWLFRFASWSWMPHATPDRWVVAAAFATVTAGAAGAAGAWWAGRETQRRAGPAETGGAAADHSVAAARERSIAAGGDISGIASTGDDTTNIQR